MTEMDSRVDSAIMSDKASHVSLNQALVMPFPQLRHPLTADNPHCYRDSKCQPLSTSQCLDVTLPYKYTTDHSSQSLDQIHDYLSRWKGLRSIPQCWKALQSVLCATFFPRCDNESSRVSLATHDMCRLTRHPCRLIEQHYQWPEFLRCDNETLFPNKCKNDYTDLKFNTSGVGAKCAAPLVSTEDINIWYPGIEGCALQCHNPIYTSEVRKKVSAFITHGAGISLIATLFSVLTFIIDWRSSNTYPAVIIFYMSMCYMFTNMGWLLQSVLARGHTEIVCRPDNTSRYGEPGNSVENFYCLSSFLLIYYFSMAGMVWFVNLSYAWDMSYQTSGHAPRDALNAKVAYFHLSAWSVPLMLTISILALGEVDGDSLHGICFVGARSPVMRMCFVLLPTTVSLLIGCYFLCKAMITLIKVKAINKRQNQTNKNKDKKIKNMIIKVAFFITFAISAVVITYVSHVYDFSHSSHWKKSLNDYIICTLNMTSALSDTPLATDGVQSCKLVDTPNLTYVYIQLCAVFGTGICVSTWVWTAASMACWKRFFIRHLKPDHNKAIRLKRHEMISNVYSRRQQLAQGCYSPSFHSLHSDPVGMNLNSAPSQDLSASWAAAVPNFVFRRGGIYANNNDPNSIQNTHYLPNFVGTRHSSNSDISQQRSYDSFRRSLDSQYSQEQLEMVGLDRHQRRKTKKEREKILKACKRSNPYRRRGSDTSGSAISAALVGRALNIVYKSECKSTSTGDLIQLASNPLPQMIANPYMTPIASPSTLPMLPMPSHQTLPFMAPTAIARPRPHKSMQSNFTFTHGMSDQSSHLTNPLEEKRRPDSCAQFEHNSSHMLPVPNTTPNGTQIQHQNPSNSNIQFTTPANYGLTYGLNNAFNPYIPNLQTSNYFPMNSFYGNLLVNSHPNFIAPPFSASPLPGLQYPPQYQAYRPPPAQYPPALIPQQCTNLQELQALMREREAYLHLIQPMDSASELGDAFLPIQLSDSEGIYSPDSVSRNEDRITTQEFVDRHIQRVEAAVEANTRGGTIVGALGGCGDLDIQPKVSSNKKSKSETKRKKKKSTKKHNKTNGNITNISNNSPLENTPLDNNPLNNNPLDNSPTDLNPINNNESEEQKPLMNCELNSN